MIYYVLCDLTKCDLTKSVFVSVVVYATDPVKAETIAMNKIAIEYPNYHCEIVEVVEEDLDDQSDDYYEDQLRYER